MEQEFELVKKDILAVKALSSEWNALPTPVKEDDLSHSGYFSPSLNYVGTGHTTPPGSEQSSRNVKSYCDELDFGKNNILNLQLAHSSTLDTSS